MKKARVIEWLKLLGRQPASTQLRSGWTVSDCPFGAWSHDNGKSNAEAFGVRDEGGDALCHCFSCGFSGRQSEVVLQMRAKNKITHAGDYQFGKALQMVSEAETEAELLGLEAPSMEELMQAQQMGPHVFPEWWLETFPSILEIPWALQYVLEREEGRGALPGWLIKELDLRADTVQHRVCFPVRDSAGRLVGLHGRAVGDFEPRYRMYLQANHKNPEFWVGESWLDFTRPVVTTEGPFDLASVKRVYPNVGCSMWSVPSYEKMGRIADAQEVFTFLDRGKGGDHGRTRTERALRGSTVTHIMPPENRKDPGGMSEQEIRDALGEHPSLKKFMLPPCK